MNRIDLASFQTRQDGGMTKEEAHAKVEEMGKELDELEDLLFYADRHSLLVVLQGRDTSGKDGTIRTILKFVNGQSCRVASFKVPTEEELAHDYLWRVHAQTPRKGSMTIFNRSHYEDVLIVRVHNLAPEEVWSKRYEDINGFEKLLAANDTIILKFMLCISKEEQEERLLAREQEVEKSWKLSVGDWKEREYWGAYTVAYQDVLDKCSKDHAPWHVVPADRKWYRDYVILKTIVEALRTHRKGWLDHLQAVGDERKAELGEYRKALEIGTDPAATQ
ncbi:MAG: polyphosphate kinase 2 family protein [Armatimonadetes bacterium]|nr:polyphosphate kinase 2 family protein [Armatimonadota bacterium]